MSMIIDLKNIVPFHAMGFIVPGDEPSLDLFASCGCLLEHDVDLQSHDELNRFFTLLQNQGVKVETPSIIELQLASRMHRWKDMQKLQKDFYKALEDKVWEYERDALKLFGLPTIADLQRDAEGDEKIVSEFDSKSFELTTVKRRAYQRIIKEWMLDLIGRDEILTDEQIANLEKSFYLSFTDAIKLDLADTAIAKQVRFLTSLSGKQPIGAEIMPIYDFNMLSGFSIGQKNTWKQIIENYRESLRQQGLSDEQIDARVRELLRTQIIPQASNRHLAYFMNTGKNRIQAHISSKIYAGVLKVLQQMAREGRSPLEVGRYLHGMYGGQLWQWLRIARSEPVLAYNAAFSEQSRAAGVKYVEWNAASGCCDICAAFNGKVWKLDESPTPVSSTHPHCLCILLPRFMMSVDKPLQQNWSRISPYEQRYTPDEIAGLADFLRNNTLGIPRPGLI